MTFSIDLLTKANELPSFLEAPKWGQVLFISENNLNIVKTLTEGSHVRGGIWAFGHKVGRVGGDQFLMYFPLYSNIKPLLRNVVFVFTEIILGLGMLLCYLESSEGHSEVVISPPWYL